MKPQPAGSSNTRQLLQFIGLTYAISWLIWSPYYLPFGLSVDWLPYCHLLGSLGPMLASVILIYREQGLDGLRQLGGRGISKRHFIRWLRIGLLAPAAVLVLIISFVCIRQHTAPDWSSLISSGEFAFLSPGIYLIATLFFFGLGEEAGWRGFALPRLQATYSAFTATLISTVFWAVWHWPLFLNPLGGYVHMDAGARVGWFISLLTGGILFAWLYNSSGGNVLACALFHGMMDIVFMVNLNVPALSTYTGLFITLWGLFILFIYKPASLSPMPKVRMDIRLPTILNIGAVKTVPGRI